MHPLTNQLPNYIIFLDILYYLQTFKMIIVNDLLIYKMWNNHIQDLYDTYSFIFFTHNA